MAKVPDQERRQFSRIPFDAVAHIRTQQGDIHLDCPVMDISLKGVLIERPDTLQLSLGDNVQLNLLLDNGEAVIQMSAIVAHIDDISIGLACEQIDLDSITHLKRLVELNLGDHGLLHRELTALIDTH